MNLIAFSGEAAGLLLALIMVLMLGVAAWFVPLRWGWRAFPIVVVTAVAACGFLARGVMAVVYRHGGGGVVHIVPVLAVAVPIGAGLFGAGLRGRRMRRDRAGA